MKATEKYFPVVLFIMLLEVALILKVWPLKWKLLRNSLLWCGLLWCERSSISWACGWNSKAWPVEATEQYFPDFFLSCYAQETLRLSLWIKSYSENICLKDGKKSATNELHTTRKDLNHTFHSRVYAYNSRGSRALSRCRSQEQKEIKVAFYRG